MCLRVHAERIFGTLGNYRECRVHVGGCPNSEPSGIIAMVPNVQVEGAGGLQCMKSMKGFRNERA